VRQQRFGEGERAEVVGRERQVAALSSPVLARGHDAGVVEHACDREVQSHDLGSSPLGASRVGEVTDDRDRRAADLGLQLSELGWVASDEHDGAVRREPEGRLSSDA